MVLDVKRQKAGTLAQRRALIPSDEVFTDEGCFIIESWNQPTDPHVSIARARVASHTATRIHRLDVDERYLVVTGEARVELGEQVFQASPGDVIFIPAGCLQRVVNDTDEDFIFYCVCNPRFQTEHYHEVETPG